MGNFCIEIEKPERGIARVYGVQCNLILVKKFSFFSKRLRIQRNPLLPFHFWPPSCPGSDSMMLETPNCQGPWQANKKISLTFSPKGKSSTMTSPHSWLKLISWKNLEFKQCNFKTRTNKYARTKLHWVLLSRRMLMMFNINSR